MAKFTVTHDKCGECRLGLGIHNRLDPACDFHGKHVKPRTPFDRFLDDELTGRSAVGKHKREWASGPLF